MLFQASNLARHSLILFFQNHFQDRHLQKMILIIWPLILFIRILKDDLNLTAIKGGLRLQPKEELSNSLDLMGVESGLAEQLTPELICFISIPTKWPGQSNW